MKNILRSFIFVLLTLSPSTVFLNAFSNTSEEQKSDSSSTKSDPPYYKFTAGGGLSSVDIGGIVCFSVDFGNIFCSLRATSAIEAFRDTLNPEEKIYNYSGIVGLSYTSGIYSFSLGIGIGQITSITRGNIIIESRGAWKKYNTITKSSIGIPIQADLFIAPYKIFGTGITIFADINKYRPFWGVMLCVQIGKLR